MRLIASRATLLKRLFTTGRLCRSRNHASVTSSTARCLASASSVHLVDVRSHLPCTRYLTCYAGVVGRRNSVARPSKMCRVSGLFGGIVQRAAIYMQPQNHRFLATCIKRITCLSGLSTSSQIQRISFALGRSWLLDYLLGILLFAFQDKHHICSNNLPSE